MNTAKNADFFKNKCEKHIKNLTLKLSKCDALPGKSGFKGAGFIQLDSAFKAAADYEGMLGSIMLESMLGSVFAEVANDNPGMSALSAIDADFTEFAMEYMEESAHGQNNKGRGRGSIALYEREQSKSGANTLGLFNDAANDTLPDDIDQRLDIEGTIAHLQQQYYGWSKAEQNNMKTLGSPAL